MFKSILNLLFPTICLACETPLLQSETILCIRCLHNLPVTNQHKTIENEAYKKFYGRLPLLRCCCLLYFKKGSSIQNLFHHLKYSNQPDVSRYLGFLYAYQLQSYNDFIHTVDYLVSVPLHPKKQKKRGYNQVTGFAEALSEVFQIPIANDILFQKKNRRSQTQRNLEMRSESIEDRFQIHLNSKYNHKHLLLLDDILTTGATLEACGKQLLKLHQIQLSIMCLAQSE